MAQPDLRDLWYDWLGLNTYLFKTINSLSDIPVYSHIMQFVTLFGDKGLLPYFLGIMIGYAVISVIANKGSGKHHALIWFNILLIMGASLFSNLYTTNYLKNSVAYPRPYAILPAGEVIQLEEKSAKDAFRSFPSQHAALITILVAVLWPILNESFRWTALLLVILVSWSRVALGVHFPMDVISGVVIALFQVLIIRWTLFKIYSIMNGFLHLLSRAR